MYCRLHNYNNCFAITCFLVSVCLDTSITVKLYQACMRVVSFRKVPFLQLNFIVFVLHICTKLAIIDLFSLIMLLIQMGTVLFILIFSMLTMRMTVLASFSTITRTIAGTREASSSAAVSASCAGFEGMCIDSSPHRLVLEAQSALDKRLALVLHPSSPSHMHIIILCRQ